MITITFMDGKQYELRSYAVTDVRIIRFRIIGWITCPFCGNRHMVSIKEYNGCGSICPTCRAKFYQFDLFGDGKRYAKSFTPITPPS
jgi:hypothetical protein